MLEERLNGLAVLYVHKHTLCSSAFLPINNIVLLKKITSNLEIWFEQIIREFKGLFCLNSLKEFCIFFNSKKKKV